MNKTLLVITSLLGALSIVLGAFGAHALKSKLSIESLNSFETGVRYQFYHVVAILLVASLTQIQTQDKNLIALFFLAGIFLFSGSIYALSIGGIQPKYIWFVTPLGGLLFIIGWLLLAWKFQFIR